jgi:hypothetical protein
MGCSLKTKPPEKEKRKTFMKNNNWIGPVVFVFLAVIAIVAFVSSESPSARSLFILPEKTADQVTVVELDEKPEAIATATPEPAKKREWVRMAATMSGDLPDRDFRFVPDYPVPSGYSIFYVIEKNEDGDTHKYLDSSISEPGSITKFSESQEVVRVYCAPTGLSTLDEINDYSATRHNSKRVPLIVDYSTTYWKMVFDLKCS